MKGNPFSQFLYMLVSIGAALWLFAVLAGVVGRAIVDNGLYIAGGLLLAGIGWVVYRRLSGNRYW